MGPGNTGPTWDLGFTETGAGSWRQRPMLGRVLYRAPALGMLQHAAWVPDSIYSLALKAAHGGVN